MKRRKREKEREKNERRNAGRAEYENTNTRGYEASSKEDILSTTPTKSFSDELRNSTRKREREKVRKDHREEKSCFGYKGP